MKKFKKGDVIRRKDDADKKRTFEVLTGTGNAWFPPTAIRNDGGNLMSLSFVLGNPDEYKLVHRPTKKDREIAQLQAMLSEAEKGLSEARRQAEDEREKLDYDLLAAGLVRMDLLRGAIVNQTDHYGDGFNEFYKVKLLMNNVVIREVLKRLVG